MTRTMRAGLIVASLALAGLLAACMSDRAAPPPPAASQPVAVEDGDWKTYGGGPNQDHYSPLSEVNDGNVARLGLAWSYDIDARPSAFSTPLAVDGVLYFAAGYSIVHAMDAATGKLIWQYDPKAYDVAGHEMRAAWGIRGITYDNGKIFTGTIDGRLIALDAKTGKLLWSVDTFDGKKEGRYITGAPWVFDGKVAIGHGGADFVAIRGYVTAYDQDTGKQAWRFYTVPGDPAKGFENKAMEMAAKTWTGEWWKMGGGGTVWNAMAYDPKFHRLYIGIGNGAPWNQKVRSPGGGDNLFLCSIVALDAETGEYVWHYQVNPGETWDYNAAMDIELADLKIGGEARPVLMHAPKNGFFYVIDRRDGKLISAEKFVNKVNWASRIDLATGRPVENPDARFPDGKAFEMWPSPTGAHSVEAMSFSPKTGLVYLPAIEQGRIFIDAPNLKTWRFTPGEMINNAIGKPPPGMVPAQGSNSLLAWDPVKQQAAWSVPLPGAKNGATLATAGNLVFQGNVNGELVAYAADTGKRLWAFDAQNGILAQPISYRAGGRQYVTVLTGWRLSTAGPGERSWDYATQKRRVLTFVLDGKATLPPADATPLPIADDPDFRVVPAKAKLGEDVFGHRCFVCHGGAAMSGGAAPDLRKAGSPLDLASFTSVLHDGALRQNGMPRFEELTPKEIEGLQHYIRQQARVALARQAAH